jgi:LuxR family transcriptional regulator, quorum-sensing system regulator BjaR1
MVAQTLVNTARHTLCADLQTRLISYASCVESLRTPTEVLDDLSATTTSGLPLSVLGALRLPLKSNDWESIQLGKSIFLHRDVPKGWWEEYGAVAQGKFRPQLFLARSSMASYTWTEVKRMFQPIGIDQWVYELALKYGMRDGFTCPIAGRWVVVFWSRKELSNILTQRTRIMVFAAASFAALRLEQLACLDVDRIGSRAHLTPREVAVLRLVSMGNQSREVAEALGLGEETIRSHLKKAQVKLGASNRSHAIAEALRQNLIP